MDTILEDKQFKTITMLGIKIKYQSKPDLIKVFYLQTNKYQEWAQTFEALGIKVQAAGSWFEFDGMDYFRQ